jgi:hypothetical protein
LGYCGPIEVHDRYCYFVDLEIVRYETLWLRPMFLATMAVRFVASLV